MRNCRSTFTFVDILAALVPRPRLHPIRFHGVLAPNAKLRAKVVPQPSDEPAQKERTSGDSEADLGRPMRLGWAKLLKREHHRAHLPEGKESFRTSEPGG